MKNRAPIEKILPSFVPVILERGVPGYQSDGALLPSERRLDTSEIRSVLIAAAYLGALEHAGNLDFDTAKVCEILTRTVGELPDCILEEKALALELIQSFLNVNFIRAEHPFDDWICEAWWPRFQVIPYAYPSAMANAISYGLSVNKTLGQFQLEL